MAKEIGGIAGAIVDKALERYKIPLWIRPYIYKYASRNKIQTIKFALSLINVGRRKGAITKDFIIMPNGTKFRSDAVLELISLFFNGEEQIAQIEREWSNDSMRHNAKYEAIYADLNESDSKRARAVRNLIEGMGSGIDIVNKTKKEDLAIFREIEKLNDWNERLIATGIVINYSYMKTFGAVFFRVFYPIAPELMRNLGKAFASSYRHKPERQDTAEARRIIAEHKLSDEQLINITRRLLVAIKQTIDQNIHLAVSLGVKNEIEMMEEIAIAYPLHMLKVMGVSLDVSEEVGKVYRQSMK